jgi:hypothetical protein
MKNIKNCFLILFLAARVAMGSSVPDDKQKPSIGPWFEPALSNGELKTTDQVEPRGNDDVDSLSGRRIRRSIKRLPVDTTLNLNRRHDAMPKISYPKSDKHPNVVIILQNDDETIGGGSESLSSNGNGQGQQKNDVNSKQESCWSRLFCCCSSKKSRGWVSRKNVPND